VSGTAAVSRPGMILAALRRSPRTTAQLARMVKGDRDDVSRAVAHLRERGFVISGRRARDEYGGKGQARYELQYDPENPTTRHCIVVGCHTKLNHLNPGYTFLGDGPFCMRHLELIASLELDTIIAGLLEQQRYDQLTCI
jgi:hypothetical protein